MDLFEGRSSVDTELVYDATAQASFGGGDRRRPSAPASVKGMVVPENGGCNHGRKDIVSNL